MLRHRIWEDFNFQHHINLGGPATAATLDTSPAPLMRRPLPHETSCGLRFRCDQDFYDHVNASNYLSRVRVPLMVVNAKDDPFIDGNSLPEQERVEDAPVRLEYHTYGGHCGLVVIQGKMVWSMHDACTAFLV